MNDFIVTPQNYRKVSNMRRAKCENLNVSASLAVVCAQSTEAKC